MLEIPDGDTIGKVILGLVPAVVTVLGLLRGPGAVRSRLRHDVELLDKIPPGTEARTKFETYLSGQIDRFTSYETQSSRDISGLVIAGMLTLGLGSLALWLLTQDAWWCWILGVGVAIVAFAGLSIMYDDAQKVPRDSKGKRI